MQGMMGTRTAATEASGAAAPTDAVLMDVNRWVPASFELSLPCGGRSRMEAAKGWALGSVGCRDADDSKV